jgi:hypothetical protein
MRHPNIEKISAISRVVEGASKKCGKQEEYSDWLDKITTFNLNARYDDYKREFYSLCTPEFTIYWIERIETLRKWISQKL